MRAADKRRLERLADKWLARLGLDEWVVSVSNELPMTSGAIAETRAAGDMRLATIHVVPKVIGRSDEELVVVHEVLHLQPNVRQLFDVADRNEAIAERVKATTEDLLDDVARYLIRLEAECRDP